VGRIRILLAALLLLGAGFTSFGGGVAAATYRISGRVTDQNAIPYAGATVEAVASGAVAASTTTGTDGAYALPVPAGTYDVRVTPAPGSGLGATTAPGRVVAADVTIDFVLVPAGVITVAGRVSDGLGAPLAGQSVALFNGTQAVAGRQDTDAAGGFSFAVTAGTYFLRVAQGYYPVAGRPTAYYYGFDTARFAVTGSTLLDLALPFKRLVVHMQDPAGLPVAGVAVGARVDNHNLPIGGLSADAYSNENYGHYPVTDAGGDVTLWCFPTGTRPESVISVNPAAGGPYLPTTLNGVVVAGDTTLTVTLATPVAVRGRVTNALGDALAGQQVALSGPTAANVVTDAAGSYALRVAPGTYTMHIAPAQGGATYPLVPATYEVVTAPFAVAGDTTLDVSLPLRRVTVTVQTPAGTPVAGAAVGTNYGTGTATNLALGTLTGRGSAQYAFNSSPTQTPLTDANGQAVLWLFPNDAATGYSITAEPPVGSDFVAATVTGVQVVGDRALAVALAAPVTLQGRLLGESGEPLAGQRVALSSLAGGSGASATTDAAGHYALRAQAGPYRLSANGGNNGNAALPLPQDYSLIIYETPGNYDLALTADRTLDITLPFRRIRVRVQDNAGAPIAGATLATNNPLVDGVSLGPVLGRGRSTGWSSGSDAAGVATLWLLPTDVNRYTLSVTPPPGSPFAPFSLANLAVVGDTELQVALQFVHAPPATTATTAPGLDGQNVGPDPLTIALAATAAPGFTVATTRYTVDGGAEQTYAGPVAVAGAGAHTLRYWSVDNAGVYEAARALAFTLRTPQPPTAAAGGPYAVGEGGTVVLAGSGVDPDGTAVTYAWDLDGDGTFETAGATPTFAATGIDGPATRAIALRVCDATGACATATTTVAIANVAPTATFAAAPTTVPAAGQFTLALTGPADPGTADSAAGFRYAFSCDGAPLDGATYGAAGMGATATCPAGTGGDRQVRGRIIDKDGGFTEYATTITVLVPTVAIDSVATLEGLAGTTTVARFTVTLSVAAATPVTVDYATADGTATAGVDYVATGGTLTFAPGEMSKIVGVTILGDNAVEPDETFTVTLSAPQGANLGGGGAGATGTGTITNDDLPPPPTPTATATPPPPPPTPTATATSPPPPPTPTATATPPPPPPPPPSSGIATGGTGPTGVAVNPRTKRLYIANNGSDNLTVFDTTTNKRVADIYLGSPYALGPFGVAVNPVTNRIYVAHAWSRSGTGSVLTVIDGATNTIIGRWDAGPIPYAVVVNSVTNRIYVGHGDSDPFGGYATSTQVSVFDGATNVKIAAIETATDIAAGGSYAVAVDEGHNRVFHVNTNGMLSRIDGATNKVAGQRYLFSAATDVAYNPRTNLVYVVLQGVKKIAVVDPETMKEVGRIDVVAGPHGIAVNPTTGHILVTLVNNTLAVIDGDPARAATYHRVIAAIPVGKGPWYVAVNPETNKVYVMNYTANTFSVVQDMP